MDGEFVFGMVLMPVTFIALYWHLWYGPVLVGVVMALVFSEIEELVLMSWGKPRSRALRSARISWDHGPGYESICDVRRNLMIGCQGYSWPIGHVKN